MLRSRNIIVEKFSLKNSPLKGEMLKSDILEEGYQLSAD